MSSASEYEAVEGGLSRRLTDYLDAQGAVSFPAGLTLMSMLDRNAAAFGDAVAYRFLDYTSAAEGQAFELTWSQLGTRVDAVAARLQQVTAPGDPVAILAPQGLDYVTGFFAAIRAGNIAVPLFAPELPGHGERLEAVLGDAQPPVVVSTAAASEAVQAFMRKLPRERRSRVIAIDQVPDSVGATFRPVRIDSDDLAYLQYTSGSTRTPAGVEITHRAAGTNLLQMMATLEMDDTDIRGMSWLPLYHDMGLLMIIFPALYAGHTTLMSPTAFVRRPARWIRALAAESRHGTVATAAPNFAFELVAQRGLPDEDEDIDLSNVVLINGSEPVSLDAVASFSAAFARYGLPRTAIRPSYGMAEATLFVSSVDPEAGALSVYLDREELGAGHAVRVSADAPNAVPHVSCGRVARSQWGVIVNSDTGAELSDGEVGEIWLHGENMGRGYWGRPEETERVFCNKLQTRLDVGSHAEGAPVDATWMRTGDLGVYLDDELFIVGRIKDLLIIDGRNHYPQDIEATTAAASAQVRSGYVVAFSVPAGEMPGPAPVGTGERLVIVAERAPGAGRADPQPVLDAIRAAVSRRHGLPVADVRLVAAGAIPRTTSGKLARRSCRAQYLSGTLGAR